MDQLQALQDQQILQLQLQPLHQQMVVDLLNGLLINGVMMKITTLIVIGMEVHAVVIMLIHNIAQHVNVLILMKVVLPQQLQLLQQQQLQRLRLQLQLPQLLLMT